MSKKVISANENGLSEYQQTTDDFVFCCSSLVALQTMSNWRTPRSSLKLLGPEHRPTCCYEPTTLTTSGETEGG